jgi:hypothetical protein
VWQSSSRNFNSQTTIFPSFMPMLKMKVAKGFALFAKETPLFDCVGLMPSEDRPSNTVCSYASIHEELGAKTKSYCGKYQQFVLDYAIEWEKIVRSRIDNGLKKSEELRRDLDHYQKKVEALRLSTNQAMAKGKSVPSGTQEKLQRNEEKLMQSKQSYNKVATDLVILMEEVNERSWRDLHPLMIKCAQFDLTLSGDEANALGSLGKVVDALKLIANEKGISPQPRLKDLGSLKPELLSTRPGGVAGLQIEYGGAPATAMGGVPTNMAIGNIGETALAPGSVAPQGLGGFPVALSPTGDFPRSTSFNSSYSAPSTSMDPLANMNQLTLSSHPTSTPNMDSIYSSAYNPPTIQSAPSTGSLQPLPAMGNNWNANYRSTSFNDTDSAYSGYSGYSAPPASAPPLPPPPPPSGYGLPPMAPLTTSTSLTLANGLDPYSPANSSSGGYGGSSQWATTPTNSVGQQQNSFSMYGNQQPMMQQPPPMQQYNNQGYNPPQPPAANQGYNPFG